ncbi:ATP-binding protein [Streptococcus uberis]|uniref:ATP-binding protein n=1 Tax=Streptococcus uberis TaxID=1349 RepID=UPI003D78002A
MPTQKEIVESTKIIDELCPKHNIKLTFLDRIVGVYDPITKQKNLKKLPPFCSICNEERKQKFIEDSKNKLLNLEIYKKTYYVFERDSTISNELKDANFDNFIISTPEETQLFNFAKNQVTKYLNGMTGNTLITGETGVGKSHLSVAIGKALNEEFKLKGTPKSVLFISFTEIIKQIKEGWNFGKGAKLTEQQAVEMMKNVDYLILDDLGAKNAVVAPKSDWEQDLLFDILNNRENTIINTNLNSNELKIVYNSRNSSRILKGLEGNSFKVFSIKDKRYSIRELKNKQL